jgi:CRP-like cAMP-binding protein
VNADLAVSRIRLLQMLDAGRASTLARASQVFMLRRREVLFRHGEVAHGFYGVAEGILELVFPSPDANDPRVLAIVGKGELFCDGPAILRSPHPVDAIAATDAAVIRIPADALRAMAFEDRDLNAALLEHLAKIATRLVVEIEDLTTRSAVERVACYLLRSAPRLETSTFEVTLPVSKKLVASQLNISQETFSRVLHEFAGAGLIRVQGRTLRVVDRPGLGAFAVSTGGSGHSKRARPMPAAARRTARRK